MFAVVVLGIGFIMVAAIFPVAIQQSQATNEETIAASVARGAVNYLRTVATDATMPATGAVPAPFLPMTNTAIPTWPVVRGNMIVSDDPRFAWVPFYKRDPGSSIIQLIIIPVQTRLRPSYLSEDGTADIDIGSETPFIDDIAAPGEPRTTGEPMNLVPRTVTVALENRTVNVNPPESVDVAVVTVDTTTGEEKSVASGAYLISQATGAVYRIGNPSVTLNTKAKEYWELQPGNDIPDPNPDIPAGIYYVVGRERTVENTAVFDGPAQDIGVYATFIQVKR